jgi:hypothetical protein
MPIGALQHQRLGLAWREHANRGDSVPTLRAGTLNRGSHVGIALAALVTDLRSHLYTEDRRIGAPREAPAPLAASGPSGAAR